MTDEDQAAAVVTSLRQVKVWMFPAGSVRMPQIWIQDNGDGSWWRRHPNGDMERTFVHEGDIGRPELEGMHEVDAPWWYTS